MSEKDRKGKYQSLSFKVRPVQKGSEIETVKVKVEGKDNYVREYIIPADKFKEDEKNNDMFKLFDKDMTLLIYI